MIEINVVNDSEVALRNGRKTASAFRGTYEGGRRWYFDNCRRMYVGRWLSWRINRAQRRRELREIWTEAPAATIVTKRRRG